MKRTRSLLLLIVLAAVYAFAVNSWAKCPQDGQEANWTGTRRDDNKECEYRHMYLEPGKDPVEHRFWTSCE
jgi:hypothetical protein